MVNIIGERIKYL